MLWSVIDKEKDKPNRALWLATWAAVILPALDYPPCPGRKFFPESQETNPLLTKHVPSRWLDIVLVLEFIDLDSVSFHKRERKELGQYPAIRPHAWPITHIYSPPKQLFATATMAGHWWLFTSTKYIWVIGHQGGLQCEKIGVPLQRRPSEAGFKIYQRLSPTLTYQRQAIAGIDQATTGFHMIEIMSISAIAVETIVVIVIEWFP